jgi:hypothetical protein
MIAYTVYFLGVASHSREDVYAANHKEAEATIAAKYGRAYAIQARPMVIT